MSSFYVWDVLGRFAPYRPRPWRHEAAGTVEPAQHAHAVGKVDPQRAPNRTARGYGRAGQLESSEPSPLTASQIMSSPVQTLPTQASMATAQALFRERRFRHVPVLDHDRLVGIVSDRDLVRQDHAELRTVAEVMATGVISAQPHTLIRQVAQMLLQERIGSMPIVSEEARLVGIVTRSDVLRAVVHYLPVDRWV